MWNVLFFNLSKIHQSSQFRRRPCKRQLHISSPTMTGVRIRRDSPAMLRLDSFTMSIHVYLFSTCSLEQSTPSIVWLFSVLWKFQKTAENLLVLNWLTDSRRALRAPMWCFSLIGAFSTNVCIIIIIIIFSLNEVQILWVPGKFVEVHRMFSREGLPDWNWYFVYLEYVEEINVELSRYFSWSTRARNWRPVTRTSCRPPWSSRLRMSTPFLTLPAGISSKLFCWRFILT